MHDEPIITAPLSILYEDDDLVAINKPSGLLVHRSDLDRHARQFALQMTRDQIGCRLFPIHRLDRPTSGVLLFAKNKLCAKTMSQAFEHHHVTKGYLAVVRGYPPAQSNIDYALSFLTDSKRDQASAKSGTRETAETDFMTLATIELPVAIEKYPSSRYALVACFPKTGRRHQIRRHLKHISHPIIGDARYGRGRHNRYFAEHLQAPRLLLHAHTLCIPHPSSQQPCQILAPLDACLQQLFTRFNWSDIPLPTSAGQASPKQSTLP